MQPRVYVETSVVSYLTALPTRDLIQTAHHHITVEWWARRHEFALFVSDAVIAEASKGDPAAATRRLAAIDGLAVLSATNEAQALAVMLLQAAAMPAKAAIDAVHVAIATVHGVDYLLTWNCAHIANATMRPRIEAVCRSAGLQPPVICTPEELAPREDA